LLINDGINTQIQVENENPTAEGHHIRLLLSIPKDIKKNIRIMHKISIFVKSTFFKKLFFLQRKIPTRWRKYNIRINKSIANKKKII